MTTSFEFSPSQSLFFLWLNEQISTAPLQPSLPVSQPISAQLEKPLSLAAPTSGSEAEELIEVPSSAGNNRSCKPTSRPLPNRAKELELDRDFHDPCFNPKKQKKNRNVLSNLVHHLLKYLSGKQMVSKEIEKILIFHKMSLSTQEFYDILEYFDDKLSSYVTQKNFKTILFGTSEPSEPKLLKVGEFSKVMRIISSKFYRGGCISSVIHSNKLSYESKKLHFQGLKDILQIIETLQEPEIIPISKTTKKSK